MNKRKYNVGIIGCGKILVRHVEAINSNENFTLVSVCDIDKELLKIESSKLGVTGYEDYQEMILKENINFVIVATPNSLHFAQAQFCLENGCDVLIEKPACLNYELIQEVKKVAKENNQKAYCVLQVRLNPVVSLVKEMLESKVLGEVRGISLTQRWQRPKEYFDGWRGIPNVGGGTLHECGIHYLDILCYLFGKPQVQSSLIYNAKHKEFPVEDTIYSLVNYGDFGGTLEVTIASEPTNIECTISILTENGYIELGGKALDKIVRAEFLNKDLEKEYKKRVKSLEKPKEQNSYGNYTGSCPNHPELYKKLEKFDIIESENCLRLISEIYDKSGVKYHE